MIVILVASLGWFGYWFIGANGAKSAYETWFEDRRADGWQASYTDIDVKGFPNRFDTTLVEPALADPATGLAWNAPFLQLFALTYRPNHLIAVFPNSQLLSTPEQKITLTSSDMRASVVFAPDPALPLRRANYAVDGVEFASTNDWTLKADSFRVALQQDEDSETRYQFALQGQGVAPPALLKNKVLPEKMQALDLDLSAEFDRAWDLSALENSRPQPTRIELRTAKAAWGELLFEAVAELDIDPLGYPTGELTIRADQWRDMLEAAKATGQIDEFVLQSVEQGLRLLSGNKDNIDVTLRFRNGSTFLGPLPIGPAPTIRIR